MPSDIMEQRGVSTPSHFHEDMHIASEQRQSECMKTDLMSENQGVRGRLSNLPKSSWTPESYQLNPQSSFSGSHPSLSPNTKNTTNGSQWESSLFSSSMSDLFSKKLRLQGSDMLPSMSANTGVTHHEEQPSESLEDIEALTIGNLLPDEDDLFTEVIGEVGRKSRGNTGDDLDGFDLFSSVGGMELDGDIFSSGGHRNGERGRHLPGLISSTSTDGGSMRGIHNTVGSPVNSFIERHRSCSIPIGFRPSANAISASKPVGLQEHGHSFDNSSMGIQSMPNPHSHSFSEYVDNFANGSPYKPSAFSEMFSDSSKANKGFTIHNVRGVDGFNGGGIGSSLHQSSHRPNPNLWSNSITQQQNSSSGMMWPNSPSHINSIPTQRQPVTVFSRAPPIMVNMASSPVHHHIGSAPVLNSPFWDRRQAYVAESLESSGFHIGSHGSMGLPGYAPSHPMEIGSHNTFSHVGGSRMNINAQNAVLRSPQQLSHLYPGRNPLVSMPGSFDSPNERYRNLSHRRSESSSSNADKKLYELDIDRILHGEDRRTTLMIKNIPNKYTSKMLLSAIDEHCKGTYDFLYLPIDFKNKCNVGYAFINLIEPEKIVPFYKAFNGKKWEKFNSEKVATLTYARIQGKTALIAHFQNSSLMNEDKRCRPILFHTDGPNAGDQEPFPMGSNIRSRPGKPRTSSIDSHNSFSISSVSEKRDEPPNGTDPFLKEN